MKAWVLDEVLSCTTSSFYIHQSLEIVIHHYNAALCAPWSGHGLALGCGEHARYANIEKPLASINDCLVAEEQTSQPSGTSTGANT